MTESKGIIDLYSILNSKPSGSKYYKIDFHLHSPVLKEDWKDTDVSVENFLQKCIDLEYDIIFVTDHNFAIVDFWAEYQILPEKLKREIIVYPCTETKFSEEIHIQIVFKRDIEPDQLKNYLENLNIDTQWNRSLGKSVSDLKFYQEILDKAEFIFFPHAGLDKGILKTLKGSPINQKLFKNSLFRIINLPKLPTPEEDKKLPHPKCGNLDINMHHYNYGYPSYLDVKNFGRVKISDSHSLKLLEKITFECPSCAHTDFCHYGPNWIKLADVSTHGFNQLFYDQETRILNKKPSLISFSYFIGLHIESGFFEDQYIRFHPNLNVILGSRGSGKSLIFELMQLVLDIYPKWQDSELSEKKWEAIEYISKVKKNLPIKAKITLFFKKDGKEVWAIQRFVEKYPDLKKIKNGSKSAVKKEIINFKLSIPRNYQLVGDEFKSLPSFPEKIVEILQQSKITHLATFQMQDLIKYYDNYLMGVESDFQDAFDLFLNLIMEKEKSINELKRQYENLGKYLAYLYKKEQIEENINKLKDYQKEIIILYHNVWIEINDHFSKLEKLIENLRKWDENIFDSIEKIGTLKSNLEEKIKLIKSKEFDDIFKDLRKIQEQLEGKLVKIKQNNYFKENFRNFNLIIKNWNEKFKKHKEKYNERLKGETNTIDKQIDDFSKELEIIEKEVERFEDSRDIIKGIEKNILNINNQQITVQEKIFQFREVNVQHFNNNYLNKNERISIKIRDIYSTEYSEFYNSLGRNLKIPENIYQISPFNLFKILVEKPKDIFKSFSDIGVNFEDRDKNYTIFTKLKDISENIEDDSIIIKEFKKNITEKVLNQDQIKFVSNFLKKNYIKYYNEKLLHISLLNYSQELEIYIERGKRQYLLEQGSMGEKISAVLSFLLQDHNQILMIDQPDTELDFKSIGVLIKSILQTKRLRQLIFVTHNPNIPVLGDAEQIIFLEKDQDNIEKELGKIKETGGFEKMIDLILEVEGGPEAIQNRTKKYGWKLKF